MISVFDCDQIDENACYCQVYSEPVLLNMIKVKGSQLANVQGFKMTKSVTVIKHYLYII